VKRIQGLFFSFLSLMISFSCSNSGNEDLSVRITDMSACVAETQNVDSEKDLSSSSFHWISSGKMELKRNNVLLSCDKDALEVKADIVEGKIKITESAKKISNDCTCLKNYRVEIDGIPEGDYTLVLNDEVLGLIRIY
jgi:hypothetical protein